MVTASPACGSGGIGRHTSKFGSPNSWNYAKLVPLYIYLYKRKNEVTVVTKITKKSRMRGEVEMPGLFIQW